jgi:DNA polymerase-3 subunit delta
VKLTGAAARRFLDRPDKSARAVLAFGPNRSLVADAAAAIARHALGGSDDPFATTRLNDDDLRRDKARLSDALSAQSLLGGPTLVWTRLDSETTSDIVIAALKDVEASAACGFLLVEGGDFSASGKLAKAFEASSSAVSMAFYEDSDADLAQLARELLKEASVILDRDAHEALAAALPADRGLVRQEIAKLAAFAHGATASLSAEDVQEIIAGERDAALDEACLAALTGRGANAVEALARIESLSGVAALKAMERRLLRLLDVRTRVDAGASVTDAMSKLRPPVFWKERDAFAAQARTWSTRSALAALDACWEAEIKSKRAGAPQDLLAADAFSQVAKLARS